MKLQNSNPIVMVDDNAGDTNLAAICYRRSRRLNPWLSFPTGIEFLDYLERVKSGDCLMPALVLLDLNMPGMNGLDVLEATRKQPEFAELPVFCMLTSSSDPNDRQRAERAGVSGFFTKPDDLQAYIEFFNSFE